MGLISFARGVPAPELLPVAGLAECARAALERDGATVLNYGPVGGYGPLREWIAALHGVEPGQVLVTNGSLEGLNLVLQRFAATGRILVEAPTYDRPLRIAERLGAEVRTIPHDEEGLDVDALGTELERDRSPAFLYVLPTFQNPSGRTLPLERRLRLIELAAAHDLVVLEDDPYGRVRFEGKALPTLHELEGGGRFLHSSSFSKIVAPGLRVGYFVLPALLASELEQVALNTWLAPSFLAQAALYEFLERGLLKPNVERVCRLLAERRDAMVSALEAELPAAGRSRPQGGYFLWLDLPDGAGGEELLDRAEQAGVTFVPGAGFYPAGSAGGAGSARLAYSFVSPEEIREGVARLAAVLAPVAG